MYASHLNHARCSGSSPAPRGTSGRGRSRRRAPPTPRRRRPALVRRVLRRAERLVQEDEVERRADPRHRGDHVQPAQDEVEPVGQVRVETARQRAAAVPMITQAARRQRSRAIATSSPSAVSSSSSRVARSAPRAPSGSPPSVGGRRRRRSGSRTSPRRAVQARELLEHLRVPRLPARLRSARSRALTDRGMRVEHLELLSSGSPWTSVSARARADPRPPRGARRARCGPEELGQLVDASAAAVARACVGGGEERDVVVAVLQLDPELDAAEERRRR